MSRALRVVLVAASILIPLAFVATHAIASGPQAQTSTRAAQPSQADNGDTIVYTTKSGKKYHADGCRSLSKSKIPIKLKDAVARGYTGCSICKPPALNGEVNRLRSTVLANEKRQAAAIATNAKAVASLASAQAAATGVAKDNGDTTVYVTRTGAEYHRAGCSSLSRSSIPITLRDAVARGYGPCSRCKPPTLGAR